MPSDGRRKKILVATRDAIKAATGGPDYFNNYSATGVCELGREPEVSVMEGGPAYVIRVYDGDDRHAMDGGTNITATFNVVVQVWLKGSAPTLVERLQDVLADLTIAIWRGSSLAGVCTVIKLASVDPPVYREDIVFAAVRVQASYEYQAGIDR